MKIDVRISPGNRKARLKKREQTKIFFSFYSEFLGLLIRVDGTIKHINSFSIELYEDLFYSFETRKKNDLITMY